MALFPKFLNKSAAPKGAEDGERDYFKSVGDKQQAPAARPEEKELLRLIAVDASRQSDLHNQLRTCQVVGGERGKGYTLLMKLHSEIDLTEAQLIKRMQSVERRCGVVAHSRNVQLNDIYWAMPATMLRTADKLAESANVAGPSSSFRASQFQDFSPSFRGQMRICSMARCASKKQHPAPRAAVAIRRPRKTRLATRACSASKAAKKPIGIKK